MYYKKVHELIVAILLFISTILENDKMIKEDTRPSEAKVIIVYINFGQNVEVAPKESLLNPDV